MARRGLVEPTPAVERIEAAYGGPEYETLASLGSCCGISDLVAVAKANELAAAGGSTPSAPA